MLTRLPSLRRLGSLVGALCVFTFTVAVIPGVASAAACAPVITTDGLYSVASFKTVGSCDWTVPSAITEVTYLVVGGGGGGASGGGGGGGVITNHGVSTLTVTPNAVLAVVVGAGGIYGGGGSGGSTVNATSGGNSTFGTFTAAGGGYGGTAARNPGNGGSGGGGGYDNPNQQISLGTSGQGNSGGRSNQGGYGAGGGGGGAGGVGANAPAQHLGGAGGIGVSTLITGVATGVATWYGGGGGGGVNANCSCSHPNSGGIGGSGVGGNGSTLGYGTGAYFNGTSGAANTGGGGGGTDPESNLAGNGGSGIVIVRYLSSAAPSNSVRPTIGGTARTGETLTTTSTGTWSGSPTSYSYQWTRSATSGGSYSNIATATSSSYVVNDSDAGYFIKLAVIATNGIGSSSAVSSDPTTVVIDIAPTNTAIPVITGVARTGETLTASKGSWTSSPTPSTSYTYQWKRASAVGGSYVNIPSATDRTYDLTDADIEKFIKVSVVATNSIGASAAASSAATSVIIDLTDSVVPTATTPVATATGFTFTISNYSASYTYALTTSKGTMSRIADDVTVIGLAAGETATVTISVTRSLYKPASKTVTGSAIPAATTTTAAPALSIVIQAPATTVAQGQVSVATVAPTTTTTTVVVLAANGQPVPTTTTTSTTTVAAARSKAVVTTTTSPAIVTTTTIGPPVASKVDAGQTVVQVDGLTTNAVVSRDRNQMVVTAGALRATLSGLDKTGKISPLDSEGNIHLAIGDVIKISLGGFKPGSLVEVWLFSTPTKLGTAVVGTDSKMLGEYKLPFGIKSGAHRVVVTAKLPNGKPTTFTLGILVGNISKTSTLTRVLIAIPITLAIGFGFLLPTQLRRRRKARPA